MKNKEKIIQIVLIVIVLVLMTILAHAQKDSTDFHLMVELKQDTIKYYYTEFVYERKTWKTKRVYVESRAILSESDKVWINESKKELKHFK